MKKSRGIISAVGLVSCIAFACGGAKADPVGPNELLEAQQIALELSGDLRPPEDLTELVQNDLASIRAAYPQIADISYRPIASPDQIIVGLTDQAMQQFRNGQYHELDQLNALYGVIEIDDPFHRISAIILNFDQVYNTPLLADLYLQDDPPGMRYAEPNSYGGDGSTISAGPPFYTFIRAWGDCPSGCIYHEYWEFSVQDGQVDLIAHPATGDFDGDGDVDAVDFGIWQAGYPMASGAALSDGDADGDGDVDGIDFGLWQIWYNFPAGGYVIPEPATLGLLLIGSLAILRRRLVRSSPKGEDARR